MEKKERKEPRPSNREVPDLITPKEKDRERKSIASPISPILKYLEGRPSSIYDIGKRRGGRERGRGGGRL